MGRKRLPETLIKRARYQSTLVTSVFYRLSDCPIAALCDYPIDLFSELQSFECKQLRLRLRLGDNRGLSKPMRKHQDLFCKSVLKKRSESIPNLKSCSSIPLLPYFSEQNFSPFQSVSHSSIHL